MNLVRFSFTRVLFSSMHTHEVTRVLCCFRRPVVMDPRRFDAYLRQGYRLDYRSSSYNRQVYDER